MLFMPQMFQLDPWFEEKDLVGSGHRSGKKSRNGCILFYRIVNITEQLQMIRKGVKKPPETL